MTLSNIFVEFDAFFLLIFNSIRLTKHTTLLRSQLHYIGLLSGRCIPPAERSDFDIGYRSVVYQM